MQGLDASLTALIGASGATRVAVSAGRIGAARSMERLPHAVFHAASTMKVAVLLEVYRRAWNGEGSLEDRVVVRNAFRSVADGSPYRLDAADDSEAGLYDRVGQELTVRELAWLMVTVSSNLATNLLVDRFGAGAVQATIDRLGIEGIRVLRGVEDGPAFAAGINNTVTAAGLARLLELIATGTAAPPAACAAMVEVLGAQAFNDGIPAGLPAGTRVAHKTGSITRLYHDAGVAYPPDGEPFVLVVLTEGLDEVRAAPALVASIGREVHRALGGPSRA